MSRSVKIVAWIAVALTLAAYGFASMFAGEGLRGAVAMIGACISVKCVRDAIWN